MNKSDFAKALAPEIGVGNADAQKTVDAFLKLLTETLAKGEKVSFLGFGTFDVAERAGRTGVNPRDPSKKIEIAARKAVRFAPGTPLKAAVNPPPPAKKPAAKKKSTKK